MINDVLAGRDWPEREWLNLEELVRALAALELGDHFTIELRSYGDGAISVRAELDVGDGYLSTGELRKLLDRFETAGFFPYIGGGGDAEGIVSVGLGPKRWTPGGWVFTHLTTPIVAS